MPDNEVQKFERMFNFPEIQGTIERIVNECIQNSGLMDAISKLNSRLDMIEQHLGVDEFHCLGEDSDFRNGNSEYEEERMPLIPIREQVKQIYDDISSKNTVVETNTTVLGGNKTETRARLLLAHLKTVPEINRKRYMYGPEVAKWLFSGIDEQYRTTKGGARQAAKDVIEKTKELYPDEIKLQLVSDKQNRKRAKNIIEFIQGENDVRVY